MKTNLEGSKKTEVHLRKGRTMSRYEPECDHLDIKWNAKKTEFTDITRLTDSFIEVSCEGCKRSKRYKRLLRESGV